MTKDLYTQRILGRLEKDKKELISILADALDNWPVNSREHVYRDLLARFEDFKSHD
jgi:hypothetical protein